MRASSVYHLEKTRGGSAVIQAFWDGFLAGFLVCLFLWASLILDGKCNSIKRGGRFCRFPFESSGLQW